MSGVCYWSGSASARTLYVALTNRCNTRTLPETRGPGFKMATFNPLTPPDWEPSEDEVVLAVSRALQAQALGSGAKEPPLGAGPLPPLCFAGLGEPLLRAPVLLAATARLRSQMPSLSVRVTTNGLTSKPGLASELAAAGVSAVSVALAAADPASYHALMAPNALCDPPQLMEPAAAFEAVCAFVTLAAEAGMLVECTAVAAPGADLEHTQALARKLGATSWRVREYFEYLPPLK